MAVIVIDPGHGGSVEVGGSSANNATGPGGAREKDLTLEIGLLVGAVLRGQCHAVHLTRTTDVNLGLSARAHVARDHRADVFVAIHFNGSEKHTAQGTETLHSPRASADSKALARAVQLAVVAVTGLRDRGVKSQTLGVLNPASHFKGTAGCLVEVSFLDRADEEERLQKADYKSRIAAAIAAGINAYLKAEGVVTRHKWVRSATEFVQCNGGDGTWTEHTAGGNRTYQFSEVANTREFIELHDAGRAGGISLRLYKAHADIKIGGAGQWVRWHAGKWQ